MEEAERVEREEAFHQEGIQDAKGTAHRHYVQKTFQGNRDGYKDRIVALVRRASERAAIVQLPAIAVVEDNYMTRGDYYREFPPDAFVVAGRFDATRRGYKGDDREGCTVVQ